MFPPIKGASPAPAKKEKASPTRKVEHMRAESVDPEKMI